MDDPVPSETRTVAQCIYTPYQRAEGEPAAANLPAKLYVLDVVVASIPFSPQALYTVEKVATKANSAGQIAQAYRDASMGRLPEAAKLLASVDLGDVTSFAEGVIEAARMLVDAHLRDPGEQSGPLTEIAPEVLAALRTADLRLRNLAQLTRVEPLGKLDAEQLRFTPVGFETGDLVYSLPLLPGEIVRLTHREYSRTETEFFKLVATSLETASEDALSEKTELTESTNTQRQHSTSINVAASVSGGFGPVSISASAGFSDSSAESVARATSRKRAQEITRQASSRAKQEHKVTFKVTSEYESEETSYRELRNDGEQAVRWDFHRLMKKWRVDLYVKEKRLTYDLVIPEPGSYLLRKLRQLEELRRRQGGTPVLPITLADFLFDRKEELEATYQVSLPAAPAQSLQLTFQAEHVFSQLGTQVAILDLSWPDGYQVVTASAEAGQVANAAGNLVGRLVARQTENENRLRQAQGTESTRYLWTYTYSWWDDGGPPLAGQSLDLGVTLRLTYTPAAFRAWQSECYRRVLEVVKARHEAEQQDLARRIAELEDELRARNDPLRLRKLEREEIMKGALRWLLGPQFRFYGGREVPATSPESADTELYENDVSSPWFGSVKPGHDRPMLEFGEVIKFLHQAVEWENVIYVLYPYFWSSPPRWEEMQFFHHEDPIHETFLRAGAARVVLTVRPGFEEQFVAFVETLDLGRRLAASSPYLTAAQEIQQANQELDRYFHPPQADAPLPGPPPKATWYEFTPTGALDVRLGGSGG